MNMEDGVDAALHMRRHVRYVMISLEFCEMGEGSA